MSTTMFSAEILHQAIVNRDVETVKRILEECQSWEPTDVHGETVLHLAFKCKNKCISNQKAIIKILECFLEEGLSVDLKNAAGQTVLFLAVEDRLRHVIDYLVQCGANVNVRDLNGNSIIHTLIEDQFKHYPRNTSSELLECVEQEALNFLTWLLSKGVNVDCQNNDGKTAFVLAVERNLEHVIQTLMVYVNNVNYTDEEGRTIIELYFKAQARFNNSFDSDNRDFEIVKYLLEKGVSVDHTDIQGNTLFHTYLKSYNQNPEIMQCMLQRYTKVNAQDEDGNTALHLVIRNSLFKNSIVGAVRMLISKGANVHTNVKNNLGESIVEQAFRVKHAGALRVLLEYGVDVSVSANPGALFLHEISNVPSMEDEVWAPMVDALVHLGWNVNDVRPSDGSTPLMEACRSGCPTIAQKLIDNGANVNYVEKQSLMRPIHVAMINCTTRENTAFFFKMLATAGAKINVKNIHGQTALHLVPKCGYSIMKKLLELGAQVDAKDNAGRFPLHEAVRKRDEGAIKALLQFGADINDESVLTQLNNSEVQVLTAAEMIGLIDILLAKRTADCLTHHWLKLKAANLPVIDGYADLAKENNHQEFYVECLREVETLKTHHLNDQITLYNLLHMDVHFKCIFMANNEALKELVESQLLETSFPKYHTLILACYNKAVARCPLIEPAKEAWHYLTGIQLPDCVERILAYLENEDLRVMAEEEEAVKTLKRPSRLMKDELTKRQRLE